MQELFQKNVLAAVARFQVTAPFRIMKTTADLTYLLEYLNEISYLALKTYLITFLCVESFYSGGPFSSYYAFPFFKLK